MSYRFFPLLSFFLHCLFHLAILIKLMPCSLCLCLLNDGASKTAKWGLFITSTAWLPLAITWDASIQLQTHWMLIRICMSSSPFVVSLLVLSKRVKAWDLIVFRIGEVPTTLCMTIYEYIFIFVITFYLKDQQKQWKSKKRNKNMSKEKC